ncbi:MAG: apolipoprotein N-acyltransferase [Gemmatimonadota bacterium]
MLAVAGRRAWAWPMLAGLLLGLSFPHNPDSPLAPLFGPAWAWVALVPLLAAVAGADWRTAFRRGWVAGVLFALVSLYWVAGTQGGGLAVAGGTLLLAGYLGLYTGAFAAGLARAVDCWGVIGVLAAPILWTALEYVLSLGELGFPWLLLGHSQAAWPALVQYAEYTGAYGVSFWVVLLNALAFLAVGPLTFPDRLSGCRRLSGRSRLVAAAAAVLALALPWNWGSALMARPSSAAAPLRVGLVQNNLGLEKWQPGGYERSFASLEELSRSAVARGAEMVVWPETAVPCQLARRASCGDRVRALAAALEVPVLTGAPDTDPRTGDPYNAAFLVRPGSPELPGYAKMHLVPFGERTPFRDRIPFLRRINWAALTGDLGPAEFAPGTWRTLFDSGRGRFAVLICFESVFPDLVRRSVAPGADFLVNITNDSWFGDTAGPYQHAQLAVLRAVENRVAIARCATSGVSLFIDPLGRTTQATGLYQVAAPVGEVELRQRETLYTRHGDLFAQIVLALALGLTGWTWRRTPAPHD